MLRQTDHKADSETIAGIRAQLAAYGVLAARPEQIPEAQALCARLVGLPVASAQVMAAVHMRSGAGLFLVHEDEKLAGVMGFVPLSQAGLAAVLADAFKAVDPLESEVCARWEEPAAMFGWGIATRSHSATKTLVTGVSEMGRVVVPHLDWFGRTVTADGERLIMQRLGWRPLPGSTTGLIWQPSLEKRQGVAA